MEQAPKNHSIEGLHGESLQRALYEIAFGAIDEMHRRQALESQQAQLMQDENWHEGLQQKELPLDYNEEP